MTNDSLSGESRREALVELEDIELSFGNSWKRFGQKRTKVLDGVSLTIRRGEVIGIVGESGSGKTTLGKALLRLYAPKGRIWYAGQDLASMSEHALRPLRRDLQMVFQDPLSSFNPRFRIGSSIALPLILNKIARDGDDASARIDQLFKQVGLNPQIKDRYPHELSGGQLQRVAIARALGVGPKLIIADEAVSKLDVSVRAQVLNLIKKTNKAHGVAFGFITHDLTVARFLCDRIAVMYAGKIVELADTNNLFSNPRHPYTVRLINARNIDQAESDRAPEGTSSLNLSGCRFAPRCSFRQARCDNESPSLAGVGSEHDVACFYPRDKNSGANAGRS